jgi:hypothetical protein
MMQEAYGVWFVRWLLFFTHKNDFVFEGVATG